VLLDYILECLANLLTLLCSPLPTGVALVFHGFWAALVGLWELASVKNFWALWDLAPVKGLCACLTHIWSLITLKTLWAAFVNFVLVVMSS
jgi:hypothetical protein